MKRIHDRFFQFLCALLLSLSATAVGAAQTTAFTFQGRLTDGSDTSPTGSYNIQFAVFNAASGGTQLGSTITVNSVAVAEGIFTVELDFGVAAIINGANKFLEIRVFNPATSAYVTLAPRQRITTAPQASTLR